MADTAQITPPPSPPPPSNLYEPSSNTIQTRNLAPLITEDIPSPTPNDPEILSPPPAYYPPPPNLFPQPSTPLSDAQQLIQTPEYTALQEQYTEYFTQLFAKWISYATLFYKYGFPVIKWSSFLFIYGTGGWREYFLLGIWGLIWVVPGLYVGIVGKQIADVQRWQDMGQRKFLWWIYQGTYWGTWSVIFAGKFGMLALIMRIQSWWMWPVWGAWLWFFGW